MPGIFSDASGDDQPTGEIRPAKRGRWHVVALTALVVALSAGLGVGGFFVGQNTRKSDADVATMTALAVSAEAQRQEEIRRKALAERKAQDRATLQRVVKKMKRAAKRRAEQSFAAGQSAGYSSGHSAGKDEGEEEGYVAGSVEGYEAGLTDGSDSLDCSDDPDVYWLPPCF